MRKAERVRWVGPGAKIGIFCFVFDTFREMEREESMNQAEKEGREDLGGIGKWE